MIICPVEDPSFALYGTLHPGINTATLTKALQEDTPLPESTDYASACDCLENTPVVKEISRLVFGGMALQAGWCNGHSRKLTCLEYHKTSEVCIGAADFVLLVARVCDMENGMLDTGRITAFRAKAGQVVELHSGTLHYTPCGAESDGAFQVAILLPQGTNAALDNTDPDQAPEKWPPLLWECNKWLLAGPGTSEALAGAEVALTGDGITL